MNDQHLKRTAAFGPSLDARLAERPELAQALHALIDEMDQSLSHGASADEVEERVRQSVRKVGLQALGGWAQQAEAKASQNAPRQKPGAVRHAKKNSAGKPSSAASKFRSISGG